ncbi:DNA-binding protein [Candidatus Gracilibacteria bacterium]|nr:DNA-binding protein [Candidatus Gracilibacteria bacterium]
MNIILRDNQHYVLRLTLGEDFMTSVVAFAKEHTITAASFTAIGATQKLTLGYYELQKKTYIDRSFSEDLEIVSITGNIALKDGAPVIHAHGVFSNQEMQTFGGHIKQLIVGASCEIALTVYNGTIERAMNEEVGLPLMK